MPLERVLELELTLSRGQWRWYGGGSCVVVVVCVWCVVCGVWCVMCVCVSASYPAAKQRNKEHQSKLGHTEPLPRGWPSPMLTFAGRLGAAGPAPSSAFASAAGLSVAVAVAVGATQERVRERRRMSTSRKRTQPSYTARRRYTGRRAPLWRRGHRSSAFRGGGLGCALRAGVGSARGEEWRTTKIRCLQHTGGLLGTLRDRRGRW